MATFGATKHLLESSGGLLHLSSSAAAASAASIQHVDHELSQTRRGLDRLGEQVASLTGQVASLSADVRFIATLLKNAGLDDLAAAAAVAVSLGSASAVAAGAAETHVQQRRSFSSDKDGSSGGGSRTVQTPTKLDLHVVGSSSSLKTCATADTSLSRDELASVAKHAPRVGILKTSRVFSASMSVSPTRSMSPGSGGGDVGQLTHHQHQHRKVGFKARVSRHLRPSSSSADIPVASSSTLSPELAMTSSSSSTSPSARRLSADVDRKSTGFERCETKPSMVMNPINGSIPDDRSKTGSSQWSDLFVGKDAQSSAPVVGSVPPGTIATTSLSGRQWLNTRAASVNAASPNVLRSADWSDAAGAGSRTVSWSVGSGSQDSMTMSLMPIGGRLVSDVTSPTETGVDTSNAGGQAFGMDSGIDVFGTVDSPAPSVGAVDSPAPSVGATAINSINIKNDALSNFLSTDL